MAKINDYFLKAIFKENSIDIEETSVTIAISKMCQFAIPSIIQEEDNDYALYYAVPFDVIKNTDIDEMQAFELRQHGWELDDTETKIIKKI